MTSLKGDLRSIMGTPFGGVGHAVLIFSRVTRAAFNSDSVVLQLHDRIEMPEEADGKFQVDGLDPGPIRIELEGGTVHNHGWNIDLPDEGVWSLADLVDAQVDWSPAVIGRAEAAAREARDHADRAEAGADRVGTAEQVGTWAQQAQDAADRIGTAETVEGWANSARDSASAAGQSETKAKEYRDAALSAASSTADELRGDLPSIASEASRSASRAKASETNAATHEANSLSAAERAEFAATETIQQVEGDFATRNYVDTSVDSSRYGQFDSLPAGTDLDTLWRSTDAKVYRLVSGSSYSNLPDGFSLTTNATLIVSTTGNSGMQILSQNSSGRMYWRPMHNHTVTPRTWRPWLRLDTEEFESTLGLTFQRRATLDAGVDLDTLRGNTENGIRILGSHGNYPNRPTDGWSDGIAGAIVVFSTGLGDTWQRVWQRHAGHVWERRESSPGNFTDWVQVTYSGGGGGEPGLGIAEVETLVADSTPLRTQWETSGVLTSLAEGEEYARKLADRQPNVSVIEVGNSAQGRPITAITIGDTTKPATFFMCAQHGDEIAGREAALVWARKTSELRPAFLDDICVVIIPAVNVDKLNIRRLSATGTNLNSNWDTRSTNELTAVVNAMSMFDVRSVIDAHEGGNWTDCQLAGPTHPDVDPDVAAASCELYDAIEDRVIATGHPVSVFPGSDNDTISRNSIPLVEGIPTILVEAPSNLAPGDWNGPGSHQNLYWPHLPIRVEMYDAVFTATAKWTAEQVRGSTINLVNDPYHLDAPQRRVLTQWLGGELAGLGVDKKLDRDRQATFFLPTTTIPSTGTASGGFLTWGTPSSSDVEVISNGVRFGPGLYGVALHTGVTAPSISLYDSPWGTTDRQSAVGVPYTGPITVRMRTGGSFHVNTFSGFAATLVVTRLGD